jgi:hypothetical protein
MKRSWAISLRASDGQASSAKAVMQFDFHPEQASFAQRGIWAYRFVLGRERYVSKFRTALLPVANRALYFLAFVLRFSANSVER